MSAVWIWRRCWNSLFWLYVMAWPRTSLKLWCENWSCARSELEGGAEIQGFGRWGHSLTAHIFEIMMQNGIMCAVRVWRQCWNQCFGPGSFGQTAHVFEIMMQNGILCAVRVWRQCWNRCFGLGGDGWTAHVFEIMMQNVIMCSIRVWRQCWNSIFWHRRNHEGCIAALHEFLLFPMGLHWFCPRAHGFTAHIFDIMMSSQSLTAMLKFDILALEGFMGVSWPLCMIS